MSYMRSWLSIRIVFIVAATAVLVAAFALAPTGGTSTYRVAVENGLTLTRSADDMATSGNNLLQMMAQQAVDNGITPKPGRVVMVSAVSRSNVGTVEPRLVGTLDVGGAVWVVRAEGTFISLRGKGKPVVADSGYFVFDDASGEPLAFGMP